MVQRNAFTSSTLTPALETLFTLARVSFVLNNPDSYAVSRAHLARAAALLGDAPASASSVSSLALANYTRCVSAVYNSLGSQLQRSGRHDHTVPFVDEGCRLGQRALQMYRAAMREGATDVEGEDKGKEDTWKMLEQQLHRRWELLGVCHVKTGDRKVSSIMRIH